MAADISSCEKKEKTTAFYSTHADFCRGDARARLELARIVHSLYIVLNQVTLYNSKDSEF